MEKPQEARREGVWAEAKLLGWVEGLACLGLLAAPLDLVLGAESFFLAREAPSTRGSSSPGLKWHP